MFIVCKYPVVYVNVYNKSNFPSVAFTDLIFKVRALRSSVTNCPNYRYGRWIHQSTVFTGGGSSVFLASHFFFLSLYEGVASWAFCSGVKTMQNLHSESGVSTHGSFPFPLSLQQTKKECPSKTCHSMATISSLLSR